jgi:hypothetical protein
VVTVGEVVVTVGARWSARSAGDRSWTRSRAATDRRHGRDLLEGLTTGLEKLCSAAQVDHGVEKRLNALRHRVFLDAPRFRPVTGCRKRPPIRSGTTGTRTSGVTRTSSGPATVRNPGGSRSTGSEPCGTGSAGDRRAGRTAPLEPARSVIDGVRALSMTDCAGRPVRRGLLEARELTFCNAPCT